jgi:hypothetical protein
MRSYTKNKTNHSHLVKEEIKKNHSEKCNKIFFNQTILTLALLIQPAGKAYQKPCIQ